MNEQRKNELKQLLHEAKKNLVILHGYGPLPVPENVYQRYLEEHWKYYGIDFLSYSFMTHFTLDIVSDTTKSKLLNFIRKELVQFTDGDNIPIGTYFIESNLADGFRLCERGYQGLYFLVKRLLKIAVGRGVEEAVSVFGNYSYPEGVRGLYQDIDLLEGIKIKRTIQVFEGVRLIPLPSSEISDTVVQYLLGFPREDFRDQKHYFFRKTLLVIDRPGFSIFHKPSEMSIDRFSADNLPFQIEEHDLKLRTTKAINSFKKPFCQALSLACNAPVQMVNGRWFLGEDKSFNSQKGTFNPLRHSNPIGSLIEAGEAEINKAKCLYSTLDKYSGIREKLQIPIDRWIQSKVGGTAVNQIIDLGIAFEALYVPDGGSGEIRFKFAVHAAWHLGKDKEDRKKLMKAFKDRSYAVGQSIGYNIEYEPTQMH